MAEGHGRGGTSRAGSNHTALVSTTWRLLKASPLLIRGAASSRTYFSISHPEEAFLASKPQCRRSSS
jgi:hypothetical protein